eukprot:400737_1
MAHATMNSKQKDKGEEDVTLDYITMELQNENKQGVLELFKIIITQNNSLKSSLNEINNSIRNIKGASDELNHKLTKLQQHNGSSITINEIVNINNDINHRSTNIITKYFTNNSNNNKHNISAHIDSHSSQTQTQTNGAVYHSSHFRDSVEIEQTLNGTVTDHDLSRLIRGIENSENKTDYFDDSSIKTESITFVTDEHIINDRINSNNNNDFIYKNHNNNHHHRTRTHPENIQHISIMENIAENSIKSNDNNDENENENSVLSRHGSKQEIISKLESGGKLLALLKKSDTKRVGKNKIMRFLEKKGISEDKIHEAYTEYYREHNLYEITFSQQPLGFGIKKDNNNRNAIVSSIQNSDIFQTKNIRIGSIIYEINGKRVDTKKHNKIVSILHAQICPFYIIFKSDSQELSIRSNIIHEHSIITSITQARSREGKGGKKDDSLTDFVPPTNIDWEQVGQILLDAKFLPTARLINQALDHLETFCHDEDLHENNWRDELCKAWSLLDDRGNILWQALYGNLKYSEKERRLFYDLMLHYYFKLNDMKTENIVFLCTKVLRDMKKK